MARSTPAQPSAAPRPSTATAEAGSCQPSAAAAAILQRHRAARQRFDSADFALGDRLQKALAQQSIEAQARRLVPSGVAAADEQEEPEPEQGHAGAKQRLSFPRQRVRRQRLQRFDSADWAMELQSRESRAAGGAADGKSGSVAHLLLERHAFRTCASRTSASTSARFAEQA